VPDPAGVARLTGTRALAFAGIADPDKFFATLEASGITVAARRDFPDHHRYTAGEIARLMAEADAQRLTLLTTEKDLARLAGDPAARDLAARAVALPVSLKVAGDGFGRMVFDAAAHRLNR
jgi:tetraacyldisaccharide 4'-kinase